MPLQTSLLPLSTTSPQRLQAHKLVLLPCRNAFSVEELTTPKGYVNASDQGISMHSLDVWSLNIISATVKVSEFQSNKRKTIQLKPNCRLDFLELNSSVELAGLKLPKFSLKTSDHFIMMMMMILLIMMIIIIRGIASSCRHRHVTQAWCKLLSQLAPVPQGVRGGVLGSILAPWALCEMWQFSTLLKGNLVVS